VLTGVVNRRSVLACAVSALVLCGVQRLGAAAVLPSAQKRTLATHAEASNDVVPPVIDNDADSSADFGPYTADIDSHTFVGAPAPADAYGRATQSSSFAPTQINCSGTSEAAILTQFLFVPEGTRQSYADATADSTCELIFTVDESTDWQLNGILASNFSGSTAGVILRIDGGATLFSALADYDNNLESVPFDVTQSLLPGNTYKLTLFASSIATGVGGEFEEEYVVDTGGSYNGQLTLVPEPTALALLALLLPFHARRRR